MPEIEGKMNGFQRLRLPFRQQLAWYARNCEREQVTKQSGLSTNA